MTEEQHGMMPLARLVRWALPLGVALLVGSLVVGPAGVSNGDGRAETAPAVVDRDAPADEGTATGVGVAVPREVTTRVGVGVTANQQSDIDTSSAAHLPVPPAPATGVDDDGTADAVAPIDGGPIDQPADGIEGPDSTPDADLMPAAGAHIPNVVPDRTLHVDKQHPAASDTNNGSAGQPLRTIQEAVDRSRDFREGGDSVRIVVHSGIYRERVAIDGLSRNQPPQLVLEAAVPGQVVVSGADRWNNWQSLGGGVFEHHWPHDWGWISLPGGWGGVAVDSLLRRSELVVHQGQPLRQTAGTATQVGTFSVDEQNDTIRVVLPGGASASQLDVGVRSILLHVRDSENVVLRGLELRHAANAIDNSAVTISGSRNILVDRTAIDWNNWGGLGIHSASHVTLSDVQANHNGGRGIQISPVSRFLSEDTETSYNNWRGNAHGYREWSASGFKIGRMHDSVVRRHRSVGNETNGLWFDTDVRGVVIEDLHSAHNDTDGLILEAVQGPVEVVDSFLGHNGRWGVSVLNATRVTIRESAICRNVQPQIGVRQAAEYRVFDDFETGQQHRVPSARNWKILDSVFESSGLRALRLEPGSYRPAFFDTLRADRNRYFDAVNSLQFEVQGEASYDLAGWRSRSGQDGSSTFGLPAGFTCAA